MYEIMRARMTYLVARNKQKKTRPRLNDSWSYRAKAKHERERAWTNNESRMYSVIPGT